MENIQGLTTLKIYGADGWKHEQMNEHAERFRKITMRVLTMQLNSVTLDGSAGIRAVRRWAIISAVAGLWLAGLAGAGRVALALVLSGGRVSFCLLRLLAPTSILP